MSVPLIFFHSGFDPYLAFTIWQAQRVNPGSPVWLLGDGANDLSSLGVRHFRFKNHAARRDKFVRNYRHFSCHQLENERLCFERWFYLESLLEQSVTEVFCFLDSDILLLLNLEKLSSAWKGFDIAGAPAWGFGWFASRHLIRQFCDYVLDCYHDARQLSEWHRRFQAGEDLNPPEGIYNVCDMTLWRMFLRARSLRHLDLSVPHDGIVFDRGISNSAGFRMCGDHKAISRRADGYFGLHELTGQSVRFAALHLEGKYPKRLQPLFTGWPRPVVRACWRPNYRRNLRKLLLIAVYAWRVRNRFFTNTLGD